MFLVSLIILSSLFCCFGRVFNFFVIFSPPNSPQDPDGLIRNGTPKFPVQFTSGSDFAWFTETSYSDNVNKGTGCSCDWRRRKDALWDADRMCSDVCHLSSLLTYQWCKSFRSAAGPSLSHPPSNENQHLTEFSCAMVSRNKSFSSLIIFHKVIAFWLCAAGHQKGPSAPAFDMCSSLLRRSTRPTITPMTARLSADNSALFPYVRRGKRQQPILNKPCAEVKLTTETVKLVRVCLPHYKNG